MPATRTVARIISATIAPAEIQAASPRRSIWYPSRIMQAFRVLAPSPAKIFMGSSQLKYAEYIPTEIGMNNTPQEMPMQMCSSGSHRSNQFRWMDPSASRRPHPATANPMLIASKTAANMTMVHSTISFDAKSLLLNFIFPCKSRILTKIGVMGAVTIRTVDHRKQPANPT